MKKSILLFAVALGMLTACNPIKEDGSMDIDNFTAANLLDGATFSQYADEACTEAKADGNWIKYSVPKASSVYIYYLKPDGSEFKLASGASAGVFNFVPARGSDPNQTVYFKFVNADLQEVVASQDFTVEVAGELNPEIRLLASNDYGKKTWKWDPTAVTSGDWAGVVWGNMGYSGGSGADAAAGSSTWWGVKTSDEFNGQLQHTEDGTNHGDGDLNAYMVLTEDGIATTYDASGNVIRNDAYSVQGYNPTGEWKVGDLVTTAILWPYEINSGGNVPGTYEILYLTSDKMTLCYPDGGDYAGLGNWGEATYWHFYSDSDISGMAAGYDNGKSWTWDTNAVTDGDWAGVVWGNMGYSGGAGIDAAKGSSTWWGVKTSDEFNGQLNHTDTGANAGDGDLDAYMTFGTDGILNAYDASGNVIRSGAYTFEVVSGNDWKVANLNTNAILWPFEINSGGNIPGTYEVLYMSGSQMTLAYPDGGDFGGLGNWGEATYWHFRAK